MQSAGSQTGISVAMLRFSHCAVPVGQVPSTGKALTGQQVAVAGEHQRRHRCTKSGASAGTTGGRRARRGRRAPGTCDLGEAAERRVHGREVALQDLGSLLRVGLLDRLLDLRDRASRAAAPREREEAGLHDRVDAPLQAGLARDAVGVDDEEAQLLLDDLLLDLARQLVPDRLGAVRRVQEERRALARAARARRSGRASSNWWQATKPARRTRYAERIGRGPKRRCETVTAPDFFES